jgi:hypothetical protein
MSKQKHMLMAAASGFTMLAIASVLTQVSVREQQLASVTQVDTFVLMATAKDLPKQIIDEPY